MSMIMNSMTTSFYAYFRSQGYVNGIKILSTEQSSFRILLEWTHFILLGKSGSSVPGNLSPHYLVLFENSFWERLLIESLLRSAMEETKSRFEKHKKQQAMLTLSATETLRLEIKIEIDAVCKILYY